MTDFSSETDDVESTFVKIPGTLGSSHSEMELDDEAGEMESEGGESIQGDLTPNDIFGLDPLDVLTLEELADYLKVPPSAVQRVVKDQKLPGRNIGGEWRFLRDAVANWLRCQDAPVQQQLKAREEYSKTTSSTDDDDQSQRFSRPPRRPYVPDQGGNEYRSRQRYPEGGSQYGNQGNQYGNQYGNQGQQYGNRGGGQYGAGSGGQGSYGSNQYGSGYRGGREAGGNEYVPPRRPFRSAGGGGGYGADTEGGYGGDRPRFGDGKRKNKRQVTDQERGKRLDRRKQGESFGGPAEGEE